MTLTLLTLATVNTPRVPSTVNELSHNSSISTASSAESNLHLKHSITLTHVCKNFTRLQQPPQNSGLRTVTCSKLCTAYPNILVANVHSSVASSVLPHTTDGTSRMPVIWDYPNKMYAAQERFNPVSKTSYFGGIVTLLDCWTKCTVKRVEQKGKIRVHHIRYLPECKTTQLQQNTFRGRGELGARLYSNNNTPHPPVFQMMNEKNILFLYSGRFSNFLCLPSNL